MENHPLSESPEHSSISFLQPVETKASLGLWVGAVVSFLALVSLQMYAALALGESSKARLFGRLLGVLIVPSLAVWFASRSDAGKSQRSKIKVFFLTCSALLALAVVTMLVTSGYRSVSHT